MPIVYKDKLPLETIALSKIGWRDSTYRVSSHITPPGFIQNLAGSIDQLGLIEAPVVADNHGHRQIVSGFRRLSACRQLGYATVPCRLAGPEVNAAMLSCLAVAENSWQRPLTIMEQARSVRLLRQNEPDSHKLLLLARQLGIHSSPEMITKLVSLLDMPAAIQEGLENGLLGITMARTIASLSPEDIHQLLNIFKTLRLGYNQQRELFQLLEEIAKRDSIPMGRILASDTVIELLTHTDQDRPTRAGALRRYLKQRRYPAITRVEREFDQLKRDLGLGPRARLKAPKHFESRTFQLVLLFDSLEQLDSHRECLAKISNHSGFKRFLSDKMTDI